MIEQGTKVIEDSDNLWVLVKLKDLTYAIDSNYVQAIFLLDKEITSAGSSDNINLGIIPFRDQVISAIDLRCYMGLESYAEEQAEFESMLDHRKQDHVHWVDELKRCLETGETFTLATDPHKCAFGMWYDHYVPENHTVAFHLRKLDEPHKELHATASRAFACKRECNSCSRNECLFTELDKATHLYMPRVVQLIEEAKQVFRDSYRKMIVAIGDEERICGLLVDDVLSVEALPEFRENSHLCKTGDHTVMPFVGLRGKEQEIVFVVNHKSLIETYHTPEA